MKQEKPRPIYRENAIAMDALNRGETCLIKGIGSSMTPRLRSGDICEVAPLCESDLLKKRDIVFCKVNGRFYLHQISAVNGTSYQISNNHGHINGWVSRNQIFGRVTNKRVQ